MALELLKIIYFPKYTKLLNLIMSTTCMNAALITHINSNC